MQPLSLCLTSVSNGAIAPPVAVKLVRPLLFLRLHAFLFVQFLISVVLPGQDSFFLNLNLWDFMFKGSAVASGVGVSPKSKQAAGFLRALAPPLMAAIVASSPLCDPPVAFGQTVDIQRGSALFRQACIGCHDAGGNIIQPGATLFMKDLQRNGIDTVEEIYKVTYFGRGRMPGFGENCMPRGQCTFGPRLQEEDIKVLAEFVKKQADQGWPSMEIISQD